MSIQVLTFGCRLNAYESEAIKARAGEAQLTGAVVINTCAVTSRSGAPVAPGDPQAEAREARHAHPGHRLRRPDRT